jgi:hypothetical protein
MGCRLKKDGFFCMNRTKYIELVLLFSVTAVGLFALLFQPNITLQQVSALPAPVTAPVSIVTTVVDPVTAPTVAASDDSASMRTDIPVVAAKSSVLQTYISSYSGINWKSGSLSGDIIAQADWGTRTITYTSQVTNRSDTFIRYALSHELGHIVYADIVGDPWQSPVTTQYFGGSIETPADCYAWVTTGIDPAEFSNIIASDNEGNSYGCNSAQYESMSILLSKGLDALMTSAMESACQHYTEYFTNRGISSTCDKNEYSFQVISMPPNPVIRIGLKGYLDDSAANVMASWLAQ